MTLCFIYAHPDDESFAGAGLACQAGEAGDRVVLITATRGEAGRAGDPPICGPDELPAVRERELREAAKIIGVHDLHLLGYRDRALADVDPEEIRGRLVGLLRHHRPEIVITFDPNGVNRHPDHVAISRFVSDAIAAAADPRWMPGAGAAHHVQRLLWTPPLLPAHAARVRLDDHPGADFVVDVRRWVDVRAAALRAHRTQHASVDAHFFNHPDVEAILGVEVYRHGWGPPLPQRPAHDVRLGLVARSGGAG